MPETPTYPSREACEDDFPNVKGTALGPHNLLLVLVTAKKPEADLDPDDIIPDEVEIDGQHYTIDLQPVGIPHLIHTTGEQETTVSDHRRRHRPIPGGVSIGNESVGAGTMGSPLLYHEGDPVVLSNAHVAGGADVQFQPARMDGGTDYDNFGTLRETSDLDPTQEQTTDSALINVDPDDVSNEVLGVGPLVGFISADYGSPMTKGGRTTAVTGSELHGRDARVKVSYGPETLQFTGCDVYGRMSAPGDSGSLIGRVVDDGFEAASLLFAGSDRATIGIPMDKVEAYHGELEIPSEDDGGNSGGDDGSDGGSDSPIDDGDDGEPDPTPEPPADDGDGDSDGATEWNQFRHDASVTRVIDGDTMDFTAHHGPLDLRSDYRIRLLEIDTAERGTDDYQAHKDFAYQWFVDGVENYAAEDDPSDPDEQYPFILDTYRDELDSFGRLLTHVTRKSDGADLTEDLLDEFGEEIRYELSEQLSRLLRN